MIELMTTRDHLRRLLLAIAATGCGFASFCATLAALHLAAQPYAAAAAERFA